VIGRLLAAAALAVGLPTSVARPPAAAPPPRIVVAYVEGFTWHDAPPGSAVGALVPVTAQKTLCPNDFWLTLSSRARAAGLACDVASVTPDGEVGAWPAVVAANSRRHFGARPGTLAADVERAGGCVAATGPRAALGAADVHGHVAEWLPALAPARCAVHLVDGHPLAEVQDVLHPDLLVVVALPPPGHGAHFGAAAVTGRTGLLRGSPGEPGLVTIADIAAYATGARIDTARGSAAALDDLDRREHAHHAYAGIYFTGVISLPLLLYIWCGVRRRVTRPERAVALLLAPFPAAGFLMSAVPWWRGGFLGGLAALVGATLLLAGFGVLLGRRVTAPVGVAAACAALFVVDLLTGAHLQKTGLASYGAVNGGRFYGLGNAGFAVLATAAVVVCGAAATRYGRRAWLGLAPVALLDGAPWWGADFGGVVALGAAYAAAVATRLRTVVLGAVAAAAVAVGIAYADAARPHPTHLGRFADDLRHGRAGDLLHRKVSDNLHAVTGTWYPLLLVGSLAMAYILLRRRRDDPALRPVVRALAALWLAGSLVNDSGLVVAAVGTAVAVPLLLVYVVEREA
jgi:hypothetical protein